MHASWVLSAHLLALVLQGLALVLSLTMAYRVSRPIKPCWLCFSAALLFMLPVNLAFLHGLTQLPSWQPHLSFLHPLVGLLLLLGVYGLSRLLQQEQLQRAMMEMFSATDPLTHCSSRTDILSRLHQALEHSQRSGHAFCVLEIDLDGFKAINDQYSHQAGDAVLVSTVRAIQDGLRVNDSLGRLGGDEFLVVLPETSPAEGLEVAERIRRLVAQRAHPLPEGGQARLTASIGLTSPGPDPMQHRTCPRIDRVLAQADQALYQAKARGRNRTECWKAT